jgi:hypothetical protein
MNTHISGSRCYEDPCVPYHPLDIEAVGCDASVMTRLAHGTSLAGFSCMESLL